MARITCGVDISGETLDARIGRNGAWQPFARTLDGIDALIAFCRPHQVELVAMEATGGYERLPLAQLWAAQIPVALLNPRAVRRFAEAMGVLEKTDRIDCGIIAWYAAVKHLQPTPPASATQQRLAALVVRLRQLTALKVQQINQRQPVSAPELQASFSAILAAVATQLRALEVQISALLAADPLWAALNEAWRGIKGVGGRTCARLLAEMPEIGTLSGKAAGKLAGLAPIARDSGKHQGRRPVRGGREGVRSILFVVARHLGRYDEDFRAFRDRLKAAGKPDKVVRVALARKLLVRLNAKARDVRHRLAQPT